MADSLSPEIPEAGAWEPTMRERDELSLRESRVAKRLCLPLRVEGQWLVHRVPPPIGPFDTHVASRSFRMLGTTRPRAIVSGVRVALACLRHFSAEIQESGYPYFWVLRCEIEDSWFFEARTPPEVIFFSGDAIEVRQYLQDTLENCVRVDNDLVPPSLILNGIKPFWTLRPPISVDERYFVEAWCSSPALEKYLRRKPVPFSREYQGVLKRALYVLSELAGNTR